jgi:hypothetical protein
MNGAQLSMPQLNNLPPEIGQPEIGQPADEARMNPHKENIP